MATPIMMPIITLVYAGLLILLGAGAYIITGMESWTALIPAIAGGLFLLLGLLSLKDTMRKHALHAASALALLAILGTFRGVPTIIQHWSGTEAARPAAALTQAITCLLSAVYFGMCLRSFVVARLARKRAQ